LIYARPDQTVAAWRDELNAALQYVGGHMSLYQLTIEEGTAFYTMHQRGELKTPDEETAAALYEATQDIMQARGMPAYEVSNHALPGQESRHNLMYWRYRDYAGIGPGAHGRLTLNGEKWATREHRAPELWLQRVADSGHGAHPFEGVDLTKRGSEMLMMGLRLSEGVDFAAFEKEAGKPLLQFVNQAHLKILLEEGLVEASQDTLKATPAGRQRLNAVLSYLVA